MTSITIRPVGNNCNLRCKYCYISEHCSVIMSLKTFKLGVKRITDYFLENKKTKSIEILFHGGEPLLWPMKKYVSAEKYLQSLEKKYSIRYYRHIQTNLSKITRKQIIWFRTNNYRFSISVDGNNLQSKNRVFKNGKPIFDTLLKNIVLLKQYQPRLGAVVTIGRHNYKNPKVLYYFFKRLDLNININFVYGGIYSISLSEKLKFIKNMIDLYIKDDPINFDIKLFDNFLNNIVNKKPLIGCEYSSKGIHNKRMFALDSDGGVYICNRFASISDSINYCIFNIYNLEDIQTQINSNTNEYKNLIKKYDSNDCGTCFLKNIACHGVGCLYTNYVSNAKLESSSIKRYIYKYLEHKYKLYLENVNV